MVAMQVANENVVDALGANAKALELQLGAFSTINEVESTFHIDQLRGLISAMCRCSGVRTQYFDSDAQIEIGLNPLP